MCWHSPACFSRCELLSLLLWSIILSVLLLSVSPTYASLQVTLEQRLKYNIVCLCSKLVLSFTGNCVENFVPLYVMYVFTFDGMLFFSCFFILHNNWMPCFPENGRNNCSFVSLWSVVLLCGSLVIFRFSFCSSFLIYVFNRLRRVIAYFYKCLY